MVGVCDVDRCALDRRMTGEVGADQAAVPSPLILRVARGMDTDEPAAGPYVMLERRLLLRIENVPGRVEEHDYPISRERRIGEARGFFGCVNGEAMLGAKRRDRGNPVRDRAVAKARCLREDEHLEPGHRGQLTPQELHKRPIAIH